MSNSFASLAAVPDVVEDPARLAALDSFGILDTPAEEGFDDIVQLAALLCEAPVALVSLVASDRQWFKARIGFPRCETDLNSSVCAHALVEPDLLVIPDLTTDPRTQRNPLVTGEPHIRFYAGAPLRTREGHVLGSLCVIDREARPGGLTPKQSDGLHALAREVRSQLELRRLLRERDALVDAQRANENQLRSQGELLQTITDHVGQAVFRMDGEGVVTFSNPAAVAMFGYTENEMMGQSLHELLHHSHPDGAVFPAIDCELRQALVNGELMSERPHVFFRKDGAPRDVLVTFAPVFVQGFVTSAVLTVADVTERRVMEAKLAQSEAYWRGLFERLREGLIIGQAVRDSGGAVIDWRYVEVNAAWSELLGLPSQEAVGRTVRELLPDIEDEWIDDAAYVLETGESLSFTRQASQLDRWYEGRISPLGPDTFVVLFMNVTDRVQAEQALAVSNQRKAALAQLGDHLRTTMSIGAIEYTAAAIIGRALGAAQAAYATIDVTQETVQIDAAWCAPGVRSVVGQHDFREYGSVIDDLKVGRPVIIADVLEDERTRNQAPAFASLGIRGLVNLPLIEQDELLAMFVVLFAEPRMLTKDEEAFVRAAADRTRASVARIRAEERQDVLNNEISHRLKNTMALVQALATQTLRGVADRDAVTSFEQRLMALSTAHDVLLQKDWQAADLGEVLCRVIDTAGAAGRYDASGPAVKLGSRAAMSTSLLIHELATNASKYGALSTASGKIELRWHVEGEAEAEQLILDWRESGGPPAVAPTHKGFGSRLLRMGLVGTGGSDVRYEASGLEATFRAPRKQVEQA